MEKNVLKKVAKDWASSILRSQGALGFQGLLEDGILTIEESNYLIEQLHAISWRISQNQFGGLLENIISKYYDIKETKDED